MKRYVISDTHFNHSRILEYCQRPFDNVEQMNEVIINNWNKVINEDDIVYVLGDFCFGNKTMLKEIVVIYTNVKMSWAKLGFTWKLMSVTMNIIEFSKISLNWMMTKNKVTIYYDWTFCYCFKSSFIISVFG